MSSKDNDIHDQTIDTILGRTTRIYKEGDVITTDYDPARVNIELTESGDQIKRVWEG